MGNQYWKNKIQLKEAHARGREKALQEENLASRLLNYLAKQVDRNKGLRNTVRNTVRDVVDDVVGAVTRNDDKTFKMAPTLTGRGGARYVTIPGALYDQIEDMLGGGPAAERFIERLNQYLILLLKAGGRFDPDTVGPGLQGRTLAGAILRFIREEFPEYIDDLAQDPSRSVKKFRTTAGETPQGLTKQGGILFREIYRLLLGELPEGIR